MLFPDHNRCAEVKVHCLHLRKSTGCAKEWPVMEVSIIPEAQKQLSAFLFTKILLGKVLLHFSELELLTMCHMQFHHFFFFKAIK